MDGMDSKLVELSVRDFALPVPRTGSIEAHSGYGRSAQEGQEIHQRIQKLRALDYDNYRAEVPLVREFERDGFLFRISGRMDGLFEGEDPRIEEIKSSFQIHDLWKKLRASEGQHPYVLQLRTYGYFFYLENEIEPELNLHVVSSRNGESKDLDVDLNLEGYQAWLELRLDELVAESRAHEKRAARRKKAAEKFPFPFERPRTGQKELIATVSAALKEGKRLQVQAPTGLGKTAGVLYPALSEALARGQRAIYVTPKNSQHSVAEDAVERFQAQGTAVRSITLTAKSKICMKPEPLCRPDYCEYAKDHYTKLSEHGIPAKISRKRKFTAKVFQKMAEEFQVCPFELQLDAAIDADVVIGDYNYVFGPRSALGKLTETVLGQEGKPNLVIDEAHNLPGRTMDYYSPQLSTAVLEFMRKDLRELPERFRAEGQKYLDECLSVIRECRPPGETKPLKIDPPLIPFLDQDTVLRGFLSRYLESDVEIQPRDPVLRLCFYWSEFAQALEYVADPNRKEFFTTFQPNSAGGTIKITCCDASALVRPVYDSYQNVVAFSATLKPFDYYAKLSGLDPEVVQTAEFHSPFPKSNRKILIIPQVSTRFTERERSTPKIAETIRRVVELRAGNYFVFFPSFDFMERVLNQFQPPPGFQILKQNREMKADSTQAILDELKHGTTPTLVFAVQGGVFSEGVDYPGEMLIGAFIVGPPLPTFDLERETLREYYENHYGKGVGFNYAYTFHAMAKAIQAAGRVIRSESDRGLIVLLDDRFTQKSYSQSFPTDWFENSPGELVSKGILKEIETFWGSTTSP